MIILKALLLLPLVATEATNKLSGAPTLGGRERGREHWLVVEAPRSELSGQQYRAGRSSSASTQAAAKKIKAENEPKEIHDHQTFFDSAVQCIRTYSISSPSMERFSLKC